MELQELMRRIRLPEKAKEEVSRKIIPEEEYIVWKKRFYRDMKDFMDQWKKMYDRYRWALVFYLRMAMEVYEFYRKDGISDEVFDQTFYDITIWCEECHRKYGVYGLEEVWWIGFSVRRQLYRLGRLQFEPIALKEEMAGREKVLSIGMKALNVHIPAGEPLRYEECLKSFYRAKEFFGEESHYLVCDSWLLDPSLKELLPEDSNIIRFQNLFEVVRVHYSFPQAEQRIFQDVLEEKETYPENTLLQRNAKEYILAGKKLGIGVGFRENR